MDRLRQAQTDAERNSAKQELRTALERYFENDMKRREAELAAIKTQVTIFQDLLDKRRSAKDEILDLQYRVLVSQAEGLALFSESDLTNLTAPGLGKTSSAQTWAILQSISNGVSVTETPAENSPDLSIINDLKQIILGLKIYSVDHHGTFPETLDEIASELGPTNLLERLTTKPGVDALIYIRAPGQVTEVHPDRPAVIASATSDQNQCYVGYCDGHVERARKPAEQVLLDGCQSIAKDQPGTTAVVSTGSAVTQLGIAKFQGVLKETGIPVQRMEKISAQKRIRIRLAPAKTARIAPSKKKAMGFGRG